MEPCSVLVAEDDRDCAEVFSEALRILGYGASTAVTPMEFRQALARSRPDVVLIDCQFGTCDGIELVRELRNGPLQGVPVVLATGRPRAEVARAARAAGIVRVLAKPLDLDRLAEAMAQAAAELPRITSVG